MSQHDDEPRHIDEPEFYCDTEPLEQLADPHLISEVGDAIGNEILRQSDKLHRSGKTRFPKDMVTAGAAAIFEGAVCLSVGMLENKSGYEQREAVETMARDFILQLVKYLQEHSSEPEPEQPSR
jgi:hypothetical protein